MWAQLITMRLKPGTRQESLVKVRDFMAEIFEGPPEFTDLTVLEETVY